MSHQYVQNLEAIGAGRERSIGQQLTQNERMSSQASALVKQLLNSCSTRAFSQSAFKVGAAICRIDRVDRSLDALERLVDRHQLGRLALFQRKGQIAFGIGLGPVVALVLARFGGQGFGAFKPALGELLVDTLAPISARFRDLLESTPDAIVMINVTGRIVMVNSQAERLFGYQRAELIGQNDQNLQTITAITTASVMTVKSQALLAKRSKKPTRRIGVSMNPSLAPKMKTRQNIGTIAAQATMQ